MKRWKVNKTLLKWNTIGSLLEWKYWLSTVCSAPTTITPKMANEKVERKKFCPFQYSACHNGSFLKLTNCKVIYDQKHSNYLIKHDQSWLFTIASLLNGYQCIETMAYVEIFMCGLLTLKISGTPPGIYKVCKLLVIRWNWLMSKIERKKHYCTKPTNVFGFTLLK